jgi:VIT1/CCC1 family predicted Fe2+/Mn2+ transporter
MPEPIKKIKLKSEPHLMKRAGWLRAVVLGANDGILSTASLLGGMAAGGAPHTAIILAGLAGLVAGATSMATGEYVSVTSQSDIETADLAREKRELTQDPEFEHEELTQIYVARGLDLFLAKLVATQLMKHDALGAHAQDELGISKTTSPRPVQAAWASAASFTAGSALPLLLAIISPPANLLWIVIATALISLTLLGMMGAKLSGVNILKPALRVLLWGALSLGLTALVGILFGVR